MSASGNRLRPVFSIILLVTVMNVPTRPANGDSYSPDYEKSPPEPSYLVRAAALERMRQNEEKLVKQIWVPEAVKPAQELGIQVNVSALEGAISGNPLRKYQSAGDEPGWGWWLLLFGFGAFWVVRKYAPHALADLNRSLNPWALVPSGAADTAHGVRAEEKSLSEYMSVFKTGPKPPTEVAAESERTGPGRAVRDFLSRAKIELGEIDDRFRVVRNEGDLLKRQGGFSDLWERMQEFKGGAGMPEVLPVWQLAAALEGLLRQLAERAANVTPSTLRTLGSGLELLKELCVPELDPKLASEPPFRLLAVDDDVISRHAVSTSLRKALNKPDLAETGESALVLAKAHPYEVIFVDVQMPGMDGFELCSRIHGTDMNRNTPVVYVTGASEFQSREVTIPPGGDDLISKPFLTFEITVKALTLALRRRFRKSVELAQANDHSNTHKQGDSSGAKQSAPASFREAPEGIKPAKSVDSELSTFRNPTTEGLHSKTKEVAELAGLIGTRTELSEQEELVADLYLGIHALLPILEQAHSKSAVKLAGALQGLVKKLLENPKNISVSTLQTITRAIQLVDELTTTGEEIELAEANPPAVLVVDDDAISRRALSIALQMEFAKPECVDGGESALHLVKEKSFDLIFLDVLMPGMDGFTLCSRIRETPLNQHTPVIFVTSCVDLKARTQSELSGATELLGKPFLPIEITVKAITFTMRSRLQKKRTQQVKEPEVSEPIRTESAKPQAAGQGDTVRTDKRARRAARRARERTRVSP